MRQAPNFGSDQPQRRKSHLRRHLPYLSVTTFYQGDFQPCGRNVFAEADRHSAWRKLGLEVQQSDFCGSGSLSLDHHAVAQLLQRVLVRNALHLDNVRPGMIKPGLGEDVFQAVVVCQQNESFAVGVETPGRIDTVRKRAKVCQALVPCLVRKLSEDAIGLKKEDVVVDYTQPTSCR